MIAQPFETVDLIIVSSYFAGRAAIRLVEESQWFSCMPLPYDEYLFSVKSENAPRLKNWYEKFGPLPQRDKE